MTPARVRSHRLRIDATGTWVHRAQAAHDARHALVEIATGWGITGPSLDTLSLVASELITNAAMYAPGDLLAGVHLAPEGTAVVVEVYDDQPGTLAVQKADREAEHGRGLLLVEALAAQWGTGPTTHGKVTWAQVTISPAIDVPAPSRAACRAARLADLIRCSRLRAIGAATHRTGRAPCSPAVAAAR